MLYGFFEMSGIGAFSKIHTMKFDDGVNEPEPDVPEEQELEKTTQLKSIDSGNVCGFGTTCFGWSMDAGYTVKTDVNGESSLKVMTNLTAPSPYK